jgi:hypothetical protein
MKKTRIKIALATIVSVGLSAPVWAESSPDATGRTNSSMQSDDSRSNPEMNLNRSEAQETQRQSETKPLSMQINPSDYEGKEVISAKGKTIGKIDKLVTKNNGSHTYAVVGVGGIYGIGEKEAVIPINELKQQGDNWSLSSGITEESLKNGLMYEEAEFSAFEIRRPSSMTFPGDSNSNKTDENTKSKPAQPDFQGDETNN